MKIPNDKLPLTISPNQNPAIYGQYRIGCTNPKDGGYKHAGLIVYKDLSAYVVKATNNFEEAIQLLELTLDDNFSPEELQEDIYDFLNYIDDEKNTHNVL